MINKQGLIFLTLTSLILVLSVYYVTMPNELLLTTNSSYIKEKEEIKEEKVILEEANTIETMKSLLNNERVEELGKLKNKLTDKTLGVEEKNNVYEEIKSINKIETMEKKIEQLIKDNFKLDSFVKVKDDIIEIIVGSSNHDKTLALKIMELVEKEYVNMYISVSFKS